MDLIRHLRNMEIIPVCFQSFFIREVKNQIRLIRAFGFVFNWTKNFSITEIRAFCAYLVWICEIVHVLCPILKYNLVKENKLDIKGNLQASNEDKIVFDLAWGFKSSYENNIKIFGENGTINVDFIFSKKIFQGGNIDIFKNKKKTINVTKSNQINLAFNSMIFSKKEFFEQRFNLSLKILKIIEKLKKK